MKLTAELPFVECVDDYIIGDFCDYLNRLFKCKIKSSYLGCLDYQDLYLFYVGRKPSQKVINKLMAEHLGEPVKAVEYLMKNGQWPDKD